MRWNFFDVFAIYLLDCTLLRTKFSLGPGENSVTGSDVFF